MFNFFIKKELEKLRQLQRIHDSCSTCSIIKIDINFFEFVFFNDTLIQEVEILITVIRIKHFWTAMQSNVNNNNVGNNNSKQCGMIYTTKNDIMF